MSSYAFLMPYHLSILVLFIFYLSICIVRFAIRLTVYGLKRLCFWIYKKCTNALWPDTNNLQAPGANQWNQYLVPGIKLVARHTHAQPSRRSLAARPSFWIVTVLEIQGYFVNVRYLGMKRDASQDVWLHLGKHEIYPVGGETRTSIFMPPNFLLGKVQDWRTFFVGQLDGESTLPLDFFVPFRLSSLRKSKYKIGDLVEVLDKYNISQFRVGRVTKILGRRLYLRYLDDSAEDGFFCHELSTSIHSVGWADATGHKIKQPVSLCKSTTTPAAPALRMVKKMNVASPREFQVGMKLEAVDPLCPSQICAATICSVLEFGYIMVKMDCYDDQDSKVELKDSNANECSTMVGNNNNNCVPETGFCYHIESPYIFNCDFCKRHGISIVPPVGYEANNFEWCMHLKKHNMSAAPLAEKPKLKHGFERGMKLEMADVMNPTKIHPATITTVLGRLLRISFDGWEPVYDQWMDAESPDLYPIGWCALVGHALETPVSPGKN